MEKKSKTPFDESQFIAGLVNGSRRQFLVNQLFGELQENPDSLDSWLKKIQAAKTIHAQGIARASLGSAIVSSLSKKPPPAPSDRWEEI